MFLCSCHITVNRFEPWGKAWWISSCFQLLDGKVEYDDDGGVTRGLYEGVKRFFKKNCQVYFYYNRTRMNRASSSLNLIQGFSSRTQPDCWCGFVPKKLSEVLQKLNCHFLSLFFIAIFLTTCLTCVITANNISDSFKKGSFIETFCLAWSHFQRLDIFHAGTSVVQEGGFALQPVL